MEQGSKGRDGAGVFRITGERVDDGRVLRTGWSEFGKRKQHVQSFYNILGE